MELGIKIVKLASSDVNDWVLIEKIARTRLPVIASLGGSSLKDTEDLVKFFRNRHIPFAINHCVSLYPSEDNELEMNQIDFLRSRFPHLTVGFSTHEYHDWTSSMLIAYAKGGADLRTAHRYRDGRCSGLALLLAAAPDRRVVPGLQESQGNVRHARHPETNPTRPRSCLP